ncbi:peptide/nickel transport system ATP-binding protein/microcin C transport system ATP-binding protein [Variovorax sp. PDC80]|uniref:ATP-binding cassette domain-containing protein n=1 Tax=Variovorax sp. PDC80 TaxID=1882827 RepID=UPI0008E7A0D8|nr:ABC transporter ATP-binding protein [Variovorax sp. PDC80]SFO92395.1 peptide/nickel transport system ATP-binding protein/microcin C transport system ATP-binding protein [Variovorax sp. PDC80]
MNPVAETLLEVRNLSVGFSDAQASPALRGVSFSLRPGEILGIVGETGAGKSLLARAIIDMLPGDGRILGGEVLVRGQAVSTMTQAQKRGLRGGEVALIGTNAKSLLDPVVKVGEQIARVLRAHRGIDKAQAWREAIALFEQVGIVNPERRAHAYPHELSGGMAQRVVIAMALIAQPKVLLADDATLGLDATIQLQVLDLLVQKGRELGLAVVLITHDLGMVAAYCDRVGIMKSGELLELESVHSFLTQGPRHPYSRELLEAAKVRPLPMVPDASASAGPPSGQPLLEVTDLVKTFHVDGSSDVVRAVDHVSLTIARGETLALVGESGSGKTTMGQCLVRLLASDAGSIRFDGQETLALSDKAFRTVRRRMQMVFQEPYVALNPRWRVRELVAEPLKLGEALSRTERDARVMELLDLVGIASAKANAYPHELTAGEQKRVGIARALAVRPDFVIFDEPTTALDIRVRAQIIDLVRDLQKRMGLSALFITHDLNSVRSLAHYVAVMRHGKIVEQGPTEQIFSHPKEAYTRKLLEAELPIEAKEPVATLTLETAEAP